MIEIINAASSAQTVVVPNRDEVEITQIELGYEMAAQPVLAFEGQIATVSVRIDNRESVSNASNFSGRLTVDNGTFVQPLNWTSTCDALIASQGEDDGKALLNATELPAGFACDLTIDVRGDLLGRTRVNGAFESQTSSLEMSETEFEREPKPILDSLVVDETIEVDQSTELVVVLSNASNRLLVEGVDFALRSEPDGLSITDFSTDCDSQFEQSNTPPIEISGTGLNLGQRCSFTWQIDANDAGVYSIAVGPINTGAGVVASRSVELRVNEPETMPLDQGMTVDFGRDDAGVSDVDASPGLPVQGNDPGCQCDHADQGSPQSALWCLFLLGGLNVLRRKNLGTAFANGR